MQEYSKIKEVTLDGRYITNNDVERLIKKYKDVFQVSQIGKSVEKKKIHSFEIGSGQKRILVWSQMHGNESTTTKALFDFFNLIMQSIDEEVNLLKECRFCFIPILNPDGAEYYTRLNANKVDLNRDAQKLTQPESKVLRKVYDVFKPHYCFNLHGQRTIFSAGYSDNSAVLSFLSPAQDEQRAVTGSRKVGMEIIAEISRGLESELPNQIARYDDGFNINCVGDTFQSLNTPTILFEAGHFPEDYNREKTRYYLYKAMCLAFNYIAKKVVKGDGYHEYFNLPENQKLFYDIIVRGVKDNNGEVVDVAIQYKELLSKGKVCFVPQVAKTGSLDEYFAHKELNGGLSEIWVNGKRLASDSLEIIDQILLDDEDFVKKITII